MRVERVGVFIALLLTAATTASGDTDLVKCKKADGSLYVGLAPPEGCVKVETFRAQRPTGSDGSSSRKPGDFRPTPAPTPDE